MASALALASVTAILRDLLQNGLASRAVADAAQWFEKAAVQGQEKAHEELDMRRGR